MTGVIKFVIRRGETSQHSHSTWPTSGPQWFSSTEIITKPITWLVLRTPVADFLINFNEVIHSNSSRKLYEQSPRCDCNHIWCIDTSHLAQSDGQPGWFLLRPSESSLLSAPFIPGGGEITSLPVIPTNYPDSPHVSYRASLAKQTCQHFPLGPCGTYFCEP